VLILGIDPGLASTGWALIEKTNEPMLVEYGCIKTSKNVEFSLRLSTIFHEVKSIVDKAKPEVLAIEELFFARNAKTAINVAQTMGVIKLAGKESNLPIFGYTPLNVKMLMTGYGRAKKDQIEKAVSEILQLEEKIKPDHAADAAAVALSHIFSITKP
jgi:crossover junction endodeoxyribonuclease RuvC